MNTDSLKPKLIYLLPVIAFLFISMAYFPEVFKGKVLYQSDIVHYEGMSKEAVDYRLSHDGEDALWTNAMFSGMPTYLINMSSHGNLINHLNTTLTLFKWKPIGHLFVYFVGFYILMLAFGVDWRISAIGALAFGLSSYSLIIIEAGHVTKAYAMAYMPMIVGGVYLAYKRNIYLGTLLTATALSMQVAINHLQITYYTLIIILFMGLFMLIDSIREKQLNIFIKRSAILLVGAILAVGTNFQNIATVQEYSNYSIRGKSDLTNDAGNKTSGLDKDYATQWSYGIGETWSLLIPNIHGGGASDNYKYTDKHEELVKRLRQQQVPSKQRGEYASQILAASGYWGTQPFTSGTVYVGAIICFLFILGFIVLKGSVRWWVLGASVLSIMLSWGHNFMPLTDFFLDHVPGYNKFRTVSMTLVIVQLTIPLLGMLALNRILFEEDKIKEIPFIANKFNFIKTYAGKTVFVAFLVTGGISLLFTLMPDMFFDFNPAKYNDKVGLPLEDVIEFRRSLLRGDAFRSFMLILLSAGLLIFVQKKKLKYSLVIPGLCLLVIFDLWSVDKRYLNADSFVRKKKMENPYTKTPADEAILAENKDNARVFNMTVSTFQDANTSYFHHSIGGYHGAKMRRYQELIENCIYGEAQQLYSAFGANPSPEKFQEAFAKMPVLNMLNTRYFIYSKDAPPLKNEMALGNAWFVKKAVIAENADEEIETLKTLDTRNELVTEKQFASLAEGVSTSSNFEGSIKREPYSPKYLKYTYKSNEDALAVFSEIYYPKGWNAFIDGKEAPHFRANFTLRAMKLPAGEHTVEFKFEPNSYYIGRATSYASSIILILAIIAYAVYELKKKKQPQTA